MYVSIIASITLIFPFVLFERRLSSVIKRNNNNRNSNGLHSTSKLPVTDVAFTFAAAVQMISLGTPLLPTILFHHQIIYIRDKRNLDRVARQKRMLFGWQRRLKKSTLIHSG